MKKSTQLRNLLKSNSLEFLMEAHNGISAKIAEEAGFRGIWASGLSISAQLGVRDNNEASWTQIMEVIEFMSDATTVPILLDGDTGYGNFNNAQRLVKKLEQRQIAGVCLEDKLFPKTNSFINGTAQPLADIDEFCGKIKAAKDAQLDPDFVVIARVEAFIAGWGLTEALKRAAAYHQAGADAILIHSAQQNPAEILAFKQEWGDRSPVVIVPTKYYTTPTEIFREYQFSMVIWANHLLRSAVAAMKQTAITIKADENLLAIEDRIAPVGEIFRLQGATQLLEAEKRYFPATTHNIHATLLAASRGIELGELTIDRPKCMLPLAGEPLLARIVNSYRSVGIQDLTIVRGYCKEAVNLPNLRYADNDRYETTGELFSLYQGLKDLAPAEQDWIVGYGDVLFKKYILQMLVESPGEFTVVVDADRSVRTHQVRQDYVVTSLPNSKPAFYTDVYLQQIGSECPLDQICGHWTGLLKVAKSGQSLLWEILQQLLQQPELMQQGRMPVLLDELIACGYPVRVIYITGHWLDVDEVQDLVAAGIF